MTGNRGGACRAALAPQLSEWPCYRSWSAATTCRNGSRTRSPSKTWTYSHHLALWRSLGSKISLFWQRAQPSCDGSVHGVRARGDAAMVAELSVHLGAGGRGRVEGKLWGQWCRPPPTARGAPRNGQGHTNIPKMTIPCRDRVWRCICMDGGSRWRCDATLFPQTMDEDGGRRQRACAPPPTTEPARTLASPDRTGLKPPVLPPAQHGSIAARRSLT